MVVAFEADGAGGLKHVKFSPDSQKVMTSYYTDPVGVWDAATGKRLLSLGRPHSGAAAFSPDGMQIVAGGWETARIFDATTGKELLVVNGEHAGTVSDLSYSHDGEQIVSISETNVYVWDAKTGEQLATWNGGSEVLSAEFSPDGKRILTAHGEGGARVWDAATGRQLLVLHVAPAGK
jgi:WD40 repeat protein